MQTRIRHLVLAAAAAVVPVTSAIAAPYVSGITIDGTTVSFVLNEDADSLSLSLNGGAPVALAATRGVQSFSLSSPTDTFSLKATKNTASGWSIPTGGTIAAPVSTTAGLSVATAESGFTPISLDTNILNRFQSPRGLSVNRNATAGASFGVAYISNSAIGTSGAGNGTTQPIGPDRSLGDGLYAVKADQSDAFGYGNAAQVGNISIWAGPTPTPSANAPYRLTVGPDNKVYIADFSDATGGVYVLEPNLTGGGNVLPGSGGPTALPTGQNHGSTTAVYTEGSLAAGNLVLYTLDEDLTTAYITGSGSAGDRNSLWRYDIGAGPLDNVVVPTKVNTSDVLLPAATSDLARGKVDGKFYLTQNRAISAGTANESSLFVLDANGAKVFDSLTASRAISGDVFSIDILKNIQAMDVSDDQKWLAMLLNGSDVVVVPLVDGIPDLVNRLVINTGPDIASGRDIAFDAANNIHYVSSGQRIYRVLSPGGNSVGITSWDGSNFSFVLNPTPSLVKGDFGGNESPDGSFNTPDGTFDGLDIEGFLLALNSEASYLALNTNLSAASLITLGDFGGNESTDGSFNTPDGAFDGLDIEGFLLALNNPAGYAAIQPPGVGGVSAIPEPAALGLLAPLGLLLSRRRRA